jgi:hypothetical protein
LSNQILLGYEPTLQSEVGALSNNKAMETWVQNMREKRVQAIDAINHMAQAKQVITSQYKLGE